MPVHYPQSAQLHQNPAFSHVAVVSGNARTVYIGGQNAMTAAGEIIGQGDIAAQAEQIIVNLRHCLAAAGADFDHIVQWRVMVVAGHDYAPAFHAFQSILSTRTHPPLITLAVVTALAHPDFLLEMDAVAVVPDDA